MEPDSPPLDELADGRACRSAEEGEGSILMGYERQIAVRQAPFVEESSRLERELVERQRPADAARQREYESPERSGLELGA